MTMVQEHVEVDERFERILDARKFRTLFQPIVHLPSRDGVGYEALVRGPEGSALETADSLLAAANRTGRLVEFDWAARASACRAAIDGGLDSEQLLFLNIEPLTLNTECPADLCADIDRAFSTFRVVLEITERSLDRDPGSLLDGVERQRSIAAGIALDDVGSDSSTLALLPLVAPTLIKLDRTVVQATPDEGVAKVLNAVEEEVERAGAVIIAEGVESPQDLRRAIAYGAQLGQGHLFGAPAPLPPGSRRPRRQVALNRSAPLIVASPFDALAGESDGVADADLLFALTRHLDSCAEGSAPALCVNLLPAGQSLDQAELRRLARLAESGTFTAVLGPDVPADPGQGVRGIGQGRTPHSTDQWAAITVGPCANAAVLARRVPEADGEWMYGRIHDRTRVIAAARTLARLVGPVEPRYRFEL